MKKLNRIKVIVLPVLFLSEISIITLVMKLYGSSYPVNTLYIITFAALATGYVVTTIDMLFANSLGIRGLKSTVLVATVAAVGNLILSWELIKIFHSAYGAGLSLLIILIILLIVMPMINNRIVNLKTSFTA